MLDEWEDDAPARRDELKPRQPARPRDGKLVRCVRGKCNGLMELELTSDVQLMVCSRCGSTERP